MTGHLDHAISVSHHNAQIGAPRSSPAAEAGHASTHDVVPLQHIAQTAHASTLLVDSSTAQPAMPVVHLNAAHKQPRMSPTSRGAEDIVVTELSSTTDQHAAHKAVLPFASICGHTISRCDSLRTLIIDGEMVRFTPTEYRLLIPILEDCGTPVPFRHLTMTVLEKEPDRDVRRVLDKHVDHVRSKIRPYGLNVHGVARFGYVLLADQ
jgi:hypothetical protein